VKHSGKARKAAFQITSVFLSRSGGDLGHRRFTAAIVAVITAIAVAVTPFLDYSLASFCSLHVVFFRDPNLAFQPDRTSSFSPGHGKIDAI